MLDIFTSLARETRLLPMSEFNRILDEHTAGLAAIIDNINQTMPGRRIIDVASITLSEELIPRLLPIADALVVAGAGWHRAPGLVTISSARHVATAIVIILKLFPAPTPRESLQAAFDHIVGRIALQSDASTALTSMQ